MKVKIPIFTNQKFFTPLTSFLPPFCLLKTNRVKIVRSGNFDLFRMFICQSGGKKLVSGVKNFRYAKLDYSAFICTKNLGKIFKIREIGLKWNFDILAITAESSKFANSTIFSVFVFKRQKMLKTSKRGKKLLICKVWNFSFHMHQKSIINL